MEIKIALCFLSDSAVKTLRPVINSFWVLRPDSLALAASKISFTGEGPPRIGEGTDECRPPPVGRVTARDQGALLPPHPDAAGAGPRICRHARRIVFSERPVFFLRKDSPPKGQKKGRRR